MWYILSMNKDVIYIEPDDDITDIITKIENSKEKIVALVPPKKAGVFRSAVNIKLISKSGKSAEKSVVIVTTDPSIVKLAASVKIPVTKNLQSAPSIPVVEEAEVVVKEDLVEKTEVKNEDAEETEEVEVEEEITETDDVENGEEDSPDDDDDEDSEDEDNDDKDDSGNKKSAKKDKKKSKGKLANSNNKVLRWIGEHKKITIACGIGLVILIAVGIWAFVIAPAATLTIGLRTTTANFSENVAFATEANDENTSEGKFYLTERKIEQKAEQEFEATGKKDIGDRAKGELTIYQYFKDKGSVEVPAGTIFTYNGLAYSSDDTVSLSWDGNDTSVCININQAGMAKYGCMIVGKIGVTAVEPGDKYNVAASETGWTTGANVYAYAKTAMAGGSSNVITVVQQSDVDTAAKEIGVAKEEDNKKKLIESISDTEIAIDGSFKQDIGDVVSTPAVGEEVKDGTKPKVSVTTTDTIYTIDKTDVEEFISAKAKLANNFKIYSMNDPFVENFMKTENGFTGKLKTSYVSGPKVTENDVIEIVKGKGLGVAQHDLKDIDGIGSINISTPYFWVTSIPNNPDKITVILETDEDKK